MLQQQPKQPDSAQKDEKSQESASGMASLTPPAFQMKTAPMPGNSMNAPIQMMMRSTYPWSGVVHNANRLNLRSSASTSSTSLALLPRGTQVRVTADGGSGFVQVTVDSSQAGIQINSAGSSSSGGRLSGYVAHRYIDDSTAHAMEGMVGSRAQWLPSGPRGTTDFATWALNPNPAPGTQPGLNPSTTINCWEVVLLAAYQQGLINHGYIHRIYANRRLNAWIGMMSRGTPRQYNPRRGVQPERGDLVFFDGMAHVALASSSTSLYSFWPATNGATFSPLDVDGNGRPDDVSGDGVPDIHAGEFRYDGAAFRRGRRRVLPSPDDVEQVSIQTMSNRMRSPRVTFAPPNW